MVAEEEVAERGRGHTYPGHSALVLSRSVASPGSPAPAGPLRLQFGLRSPHIFNMPPQPSFAT
eukprot:scaffold776_cov47-Phaeocystis_antarctica.AAC.3